MRDFIVNLFRYFWLPILAVSTFVVSITVFMILSPKVQTTYYAFGTLQQCASMKDKNDELASLNCNHSEFHSQQMAKKHEWKFTSESNCQLWFGDSCYESNKKWLVKPSGYAVGIAGTLMQVAPIYHSQRLGTHLLPDLTPLRYGKQTIETYSNNKAEAVARLSSPRSMYDQGCIYEEGNGSKFCSTRFSALLKGGKTTMWAN